jgi:ribosome maturation factor RimP
MQVDPGLHAQLTALVAGEGLKLVATEVVGSGPKTVLRLIVDGPDGVDLQSCAAVSRQVSALLDVADPIHHRYTLEVSSPGLDRKLYSAEDYDAFRGHQVKVRMKPSYREARVVIGTLVGLVEGRVDLDLDNGDRCSLPSDEVFETRLEVDWKEIFKKGKSRQ